MFPQFYYRSTPVAEIRLTRSKISLSDRTTAGISRRINPSLAKTKTLITLSTWLTMPSRSRDKVYLAKI